MRKWLAPLAFVPAVAWGQVDCRSVTAHEAFAKSAVKVADAKQAGVGSRQLMQGIGEASAPVRALVRKSSDGQIQRRRPAWGAL